MWKKYPVNGHYLKYAPGKEVTPRRSLSDGLVKSLHLTRDKKYGIKSIQDDDRFGHRTILVINDEGLEREYDPYWFEVSVNGKHRK